MRFLTLALSLLADLHAWVHWRRRCDHVPSLFTAPLCCGLCGERLT